MLRASLEPIRTAFRDYEIMPFRILQPYSPDLVLEHHDSSDPSSRSFQHGGAWWAYRFGFSDQMPKNDVPNVSVIAGGSGIDITVNAELQPAQEVFTRRVRKDAALFDKLLRAYGGLRLKAYLKYEHQPRFYHWIPVADIRPSGFAADSILHLYDSQQRDFLRQRDQHLHFIEENSPALSAAMLAHLRSHNRTLNLALRLAVVLDSNSPFWSSPFTLRVDYVVKAIARMKPLLDFFIR